MSRIRRALGHVHRVEFLHSIVPAIVTALAVAAGSLHVRKADEPMSTVIVPMLWGLGGFACALLVIHGGEFLYRLIFGKAPKGCPRTLKGISTAKLERELRNDLPARLPGMVITHQSLEVRNFTNELQRLLDRCDWNIAHVSHRLDPTSDVLIEIPIQGSLGLEELARFLNRHGYRTIVIPTRGGDSSSFITVGEMSS